jgi:uncharacterized membrane protein YphA (DoxX/SURF4 family)
MRLDVGLAMAVRGIIELQGRPPIGPAVLDALDTGVGILLLLGLWTPFAGALVAVIELWNAFSHPHDPWASILLGTIGASLSLLGPGAWSVDARLFGWKRIDVWDRNN